MHARYWLFFKPVSRLINMTIASIGQKMGSDAINARGGSMDTSSYERIIDTNTSNYRTVGLVLSLVGGFGTLLSGYALYKEL